ncbi:MAG: glycosyl hydrolase family 28-related protein [Nibricoccus sp.]
MNPLPRWLLCASALILGGIACRAADAEFSQLWGEHGEKWDRAGRLPDFSYAGYHRGEVPIPDLPVAANVKDFGAVGDGEADDTAAFQKAIDATGRGAVLVPAGRYKITKVVRIGKSGVVLRGAGADRSVLWFPLGLDEVYPRQQTTSSGAPASAHSFDGGFVTLAGDYRAKPLAKIRETALRGDKTVLVDHAETLSVGQQVLVSVRETKEHSLKTYLYNGDPGDISKGKMLDTKMLMRVVAIAGDRVTFDRPLRFETRPEWKPEVQSFEPTVSESGIESLGFVFPATQYRGHFKENGANAIELLAVFNCWVRDVAIRNGDMGVNIMACQNTVDGVRITADPERELPQKMTKAWTGHHAIQCKKAEDNLVTHFTLETAYVHDLSVEHASGNVFANGRGVDLNFDHHKDTPYENLYTDIDCGAGRRLWNSGGGTGLGRQCAGWGTFWSIRAERSLEAPPAGWGAKSMNVVGLFTKQPAAMTSAGVWFEVVPPERLQPRDLHAAQLAARLGATTTGGR